MQSRELTSDFSDFSALEFTVFELLSFIGLVQCIFIVVHIGFNTSQWQKAALPILYFVLIGTGFAFDFSDRFVAQIWNYFEIAHLIIWLSGPVIVPLVIIQIIKIQTGPSLKECMILLLPLAAIIVTAGLGAWSESCDSALDCLLTKDYLALSFIFAAEISFFMLWRRKDLFEGLKSMKTGKERYWIVLMLIISNIALLVLLLGYLGYDQYPEELLMIRTLLGLTLVYLVSTSLFRIYPQSLELLSAGRRTETLSDSDREVAKRIQDLLSLQKVYHESRYGRSDLARELEESEMTISRVINLHFQKSLPQLLNEYRIEDAKRLLLQTDENIQIIGEEVGFNSLATFNRVFKDITGMSPGEYRKNIIT